MQSINTVFYDSIYKKIKPPLLGEHAFSLAGFVCESAHVIFGGSGGIMSTARQKLPYPCNSQAQTRGGGSNVTVRTHGYK